MKPLDHGTIINANVDITEWLDDMESEIGEYDDLFDNLLCGLKTYVKKYPETLLDSVLSNKKELEEFDREEKFMKRYKKQTIHSIFNILRGDENE